MARRRLRTRSVSIRGGGGVLYRRRLRAPRAGIARGCRRGGVREARVRRTPARGVPLFRHGDGPRRVHVRLGARGWARVHLRMGRRRSARPRRRGTPERAGRVPNLRADARRRPRGGGRRAGERLETSRGVREPRRARVHVGKRFVRPTRSRRSRHAIRAQDGGGASGRQRHRRRRGRQAHRRGGRYGRGVRVGFERTRRVGSRSAATETRQHHRADANASRMDSRRVHHPTAARAAAARAPRAAVVSARDPTAARRAGRVLARGSTPRASAHGHGG